MLAPVIEHHRNVHDAALGQPRDEAQRQVVILRAVEPRPKSTDGAHARGPISGKMCDQVVRQEEIRVPIRLEVGIAAQAVRIDLVLVGVEQLRFGMGSYLLGNVEQRVRGELVIVIEQRDELAGPHVQRRLAGGSYPAV